MSESKSEPSAQSIFKGVLDNLEKQDWYQAALNDWPSPISHELWQLSNMLRAGTDAGGILMQVRDVAEVLLKTHTLIIIADSMDSIDEPKRTALRQRLMHKLSMGHWIEMFREVSKTLVEASITGSEMKALRSNFLEAFNTYISQRNSDIGHGAYRPDSVNLARRIRDQLLGKYDQDTHAYSGGLDRAFGAVYDSGLWTACQLRIASPGGDAMSGFESLHKSHADGTKHRLIATPIFLTRGHRSLDLTPFISGRDCAECQHHDAFLYDSPKSYKRTGHGSFEFLDYAFGHRLNVNTNIENPEFSDLLLSVHDDQVIDASIAQAQGRSEGEFTSGQVIKLLEDVMFDRRFVSPEWLRERLRDHMRTHNKGLIWLRAPGHVGKTMFIHGLVGDGLSDAQRRLQNDILGDETPVAVAPVFFKREYRHNAAQFASQLEYSVKTAGRSDSNYALSLAREGDPKTLQESFCKFCHEAIQKKRPTFSRLVIAIDGLDELPDPGTGLSPVDYIPTAEDLPEGVTVLLTSRPLNACPAWMQGRLGSRTNLGESWDSGVDNPKYQAMLRTYVGQFSGVEPKEKDFERVYKAIMKRSDGLFLFVSFLCDLIREGASVDDPKLTQAAH